MTEFFNGLVLGIETSCDETSASLIRGHTILTNVIASQVDMHKKWGGIVPEAAARAHVEAILPVIIEALDGNKPDAISVTCQPGLVGALSVGVTAAKSLALAWKVPFLGVHHIEGHILSVFANDEEPAYPQVCLVASGGHTEVVWVQEPCNYRILGQTIDDAAGEAFDKSARLLGLGYPGGKAIQEYATHGNPSRYSLPRGLPKDPYNFSFSGLKTAMLRLVETEGNSINVNDASASLQQAIVDSLVKKTLYALDESGAKGLALVGGVAANNLLRLTLQEQCTRRNVQFCTPAYELCTDNAAMIALAGSIRLANGERSDFELDCAPNGSLPAPID